MCRGIPLQSLIGASPSLESQYVIEGCAQCASMRLIKPRGQQGNPTPAEPCTRDGGFAISQSSKKHGTFVRWAMTSSRTGALFNLRKAGFHRGTRGHVRATSPGNMSIQSRVRAELRRPLLTAAPTNNYNVSTELAAASFGFEPQSVPTEPQTPWPFKASKHLKRISQTEKPASGHLLLRH